MASTTRGFLLHNDTGKFTTEGLGSHARGNLYPFLQLALECQLTPIFNNDNLPINDFRSYSDINLADFLEFDTSISIPALLEAGEVIEINTWSDSEHGNSYGKVSNLVDNINELLLKRETSTKLKSKSKSHSGTGGTAAVAATQYNLEVCNCCQKEAPEQQKAMSVCSGCKTAAYCSRQCQVADWKSGHKRQCKERAANNAAALALATTATSNANATSEEDTTTVKMLVIEIQGVLKYTDPTLPVLHWFHQRTARWRCQQPKPQSQLQLQLKEQQVSIRTAVHIRCFPASAGMGDANDLSKFVAVLEQMEKINPRVTAGPEFHIFTPGEEHFTLEDQSSMEKRFPACVIHRGKESVLLDDLRCMATSDVFVASASHFSALAGYMSHGEESLIILTEGNEYFDVHKKIRGNVVVSGNSGKDRKRLKVAMQRVLPSQLDLLENDMKTEENNNAGETKTKV